MASSARVLIPSVGVRQREFMEVVTLLVYELVQGGFMGSPCLRWGISNPLLGWCNGVLTSDMLFRWRDPWVDSPLARAVRNGAICHLEEVVEARKDATVVIHPLADDRRALPMEKIAE